MVYLFNFAKGANRAPRITYLPSTRRNKPLYVVRILYSRGVSHIQRFSVCGPPDRHTRIITTDRERIKPLKIITDYERFTKRDSST